MDIIHVVVDKVIQVFKVFYFYFTYQKKKFSTSTCLISELLLFIFPIICLSMILHNLVILPI
jgi:hypothetical protein